MMNESARRELDIYRKVLERMRDDYGHGTSIQEVLLWICDALQAGDQIRKEEKK